MFKKIRIFQFTVLALLFCIMVGVSTLLAGLINDPKFPGEFAGCWILMIVNFMLWLFVSHALFTRWTKDSK